MAVGTSTVQVVMPAMGDSVAEGTVLEWHKQEGDTVEADETLVEISTDKVDAEVPAPVAGTVLRIHAAEGDTVAVGEVLAEISTNGVGGAGRSRFRRVPDRRRMRRQPPRRRPRQTASPARQPAIDIVTPTGGESVTEGTILEWSVKVGDTVHEGDTVVEISTDKVDMELPAPASGTITEILAQEGETVTVGQVIARMTTSVSAAARPKPGPAPQESEAPVHPQSTANASPVARRVAAEQGIDLELIRGSARGGRITKADVLAAAGNGATATPDGRPRRRPPCSREAQRRSPDTWTRAGRFRPRPRSGRSPCPRSSSGARSSRKPATGSRSRI